MTENSSAKSEADFNEKIKECEKLLSTVSFDGNFYGDVFPITFFASIIELSKSISILIEKNRVHDNFPLLRACQELSVDIQNLCSDEKYFLNLLYNHEIEWKALLKQSQAGNIFVKRLAEAGNLEDIIREKSDELKKIREEGGKHMDRKKRFAKAGRSNEFSTVYRLNSLYTHTSLQSSLSRHIIEGNEKISFVLERNDIDGTKSTILTGAYDFLDLSIDSIKERFSS